MFRFLSLLIVLASCLAAGAQTPPPISTPFVRLTSMMQVDREGQPSGFSIDLSRMLAEELGAELRITPVVSLRGVTASLTSGRLDMVAGLAALPQIAGATVLSDPVATDYVQIAVLQDQSPAPNAAAPRSDMRLGIVPPVVGANESELLAANRPVTFANAEAAVQALLLREIDAVMLPASITYGIARQMGVDGRIAFVGEPVRSFERYVVLHQSRAALLPDINAALARMEADGRLDDLRQRYRIFQQTPQPDVLRVGVIDAPPLVSVLPDGSFSGFAVESLRVLADRAGLTLEFQQIARNAYLGGPVAAGVDMIPALIRTQPREALMDFTSPLTREALVLFAQDDGGAGRRDAGSDQVIAAVTSVVAQGARAGGLSVQSVAPSRQDAFEALRRGEVAAVVDYRRIGLRYLRDNEITGIQLVSGEPLYFLETSIALRPGLGAVRDRLSAVIAGFVLSQDYAELEQRFLQDPVFWTQARRQTAFGAVAVLVALMAAGLLWQRRQDRSRQVALAAQQQSLAREQAHSEELSRLVTELERSNRELDEFAYIASHDLKEPLRGISINADFLLREQVSPPIAERATRMRHLAERMEGLISDLLFFSRLGRGGAARDQVDPAPLVKAIQSDLSEWLDAEGAELVLLGDLPALYVEKAKLKTVLQNLIVNGVRYNDASPKRVEIGFVAEAEANGRVLHNALFVRDNGIGIDAKYRDTVFRIFSRLHSSDAYDGGTGSGLAFVRKIVEDHGGEVDFAPTPGAGTTFYVTFPLATQAR